MHTSKLVSLNENELYSRLSAINVNHYSDVNPKEVLLLQHVWKQKKKIYVYPPRESYPLLYCHGSYSYPII